ncbi:MAG: choice-of-anchor tandem repeat NxxGxxAF-containing protein [Planctomycetota bacterium]
MPSFRLINRLGMLAGLFTLVGATGIPALPTAAYAQIEITTVVLTGDPAPGTDARFRGLGVPVINAHGQTAFVGFLAGSGVDGPYNGGLWSGSKDALRLVARAGEAVPGTEVRYGFIGTPDLSATEAIAVRGFVEGEGVTRSNSESIWSGTTDGFTLVAREGNRAPGTEARFTEFFPPALSRADQPVFWGKLAGAGVTAHNDEGIWSGSEDSLRLVIREGDPAPGTEARYGSLSSPAVNHAGQFAFRGALTGPGVDSDNQRGMWVGFPDALQLVARWGAAAPGTEAVFDTFGVPMLNENGQIAFVGSLRGERMDASNNTGIWMGTPGMLELVAQSGQDAPGTDLPYRGFLAPVLGDAGQLAFIAGLGGDGITDRSQFGIWAGPPDSLRLIARRGDTAPGTNAQFDLFLTTPVVNAAGQAAFLASIKGVGATEELHPGLWGVTREGDVKLIALKGQPFDVSDDPHRPDLRTVESIKLMPSNAAVRGMFNAFNNQGQITFRLTFTNNTAGIFIANLGGVP